MKKLYGLFVLSFFLLSSSLFAATFLYPLNTPKQEAQFSHLLKSLRCLVCQNQDLAESNAGLAQDLRKQIYDLVVAGQTDDEIIRYLTVRYGDFILFKPPLKLLTAFLWFSPFLFLGCGLLVFWHSISLKSKI